MLKKIILGLGLFLSSLAMVNNAYHYPVNSGYDAMLHMRYAKIISEEGRIPTFEETRENYNPPLFYMASGLAIRLYSYLSGTDFFEAAKVWQYANIILSLLSVYLWLQVIKVVYPKKTWLNLGYLLLLLSLPVWYKTIAMYSLETWFLFTVSFTVWFFVTRFRVKPNLFNLIILAMILVLNLLTRLSAVALLAASIVGIFSVAYAKKLKLKQLFLYIITLGLILGIGTGWFYLGRQDQGIYGVGEGGEPDLPFFKRQPLSFYIDVPFNLMMTYPVRQSTPVNKLVPIFYSEFWGDFWNYFPQRRFGQTVTEVRRDREATVPQRVKALVLQNQINILSTLLMLVGFLAVVTRLVRKIPHPDEQWLIELFLVSLSVITWAGFLILLTKFPSWKGDSIKASYMLSLMPIFVYFLVEAIRLLSQKKRYLLVPVVIWLTFASIINFSFSWF